MPPKKSATALGRRARRTAHARLAERRRARVARQDPSQLRDHVGARAPGTAAARSTGATIPATSLAQGSSRRRQRRCTVTAAVREDGSRSVHGNTTGRPSRTARTSTARVASGTEHEADAPRPRRPTGQGEADAPRRRRPAGQGEARQGKARGRGGGASLICHRATRTTSIFRQRHTFLRRAPATLASSTHATPRGAQAARTPRRPAAARRARRARGQFQAARARWCRQP